MKSYLRAVLGRAMPTGRREKAFTLIELLIVIAIIAVLTVAFLPGALKAPAKARDAQRQKAVHDIAAALESYYAEKNGTLPVTPTNGCLNDVDAAAGIAALKTYFANNSFPKDPKPVTPTGVANACSDVLMRDRYLYKNLGDNYVIGAVLEVAGSGNTSAGTSTVIGYTTAAHFATLKTNTLASGGGSGTPTTFPGLYVRLGP